MKKLFVTKKGWVWFSVLAIGILIITIALFMDCCPREGSVTGGWDWWPWMRHKLWLAAGMICNVVIAYSSMLTAAVIFYYTVTDSRRLGIPYRRIVDYTVGSKTIPALFVVTLLLTVFMVLAYHIPWKHTMYVSALYTLALQTGMIAVILCSTSFEFDKWVICREERKRYLKDVKLEEADSMSWLYFTEHLEQALHSEESISDKTELMKELLSVPFSEEAGILFTPKRPAYVTSKNGNPEKIYQFYFYNISSAFRGLNGSDREIERQELYQCLGDFLKNLYGYLKEEGEKAAFTYDMTVSGILNGMVYSGIEDGHIFCNYIISDCIPQELINRHLHLCVLFREVLSLVDEDGKAGCKKIEKLQEWEPVKMDQDIRFYADCWNIWLGMFRASQKDSWENRMLHFRAAMQTMTGCSNKSQAVLEMLLPMAGER